MNDWSVVIPYRLQRKEQIEEWRSDTLNSRKTDSHAREEDRNQRPAHNLLGGVAGTQVDR